MRREGGKKGKLFLIPEEKYDMTQQLHSIPIKILYNWKAKYRGTKNRRSGMKI